MPRTSVPLQGNLEQHPLCTVLRELLRDGRDGCLTVTRGGITRRLYLQGGMIVYGSSNERADRLGEILIAQGKLSRADHKKYWQRSRAEHRLLGITLVLNGRITLGDLYQGVTAQVVTILDRLQKWRAGEFAFEAGGLPEPGTVLLCIPLALYLKGEAEAKAPRKPAAKRRGAKAAAGSAAAPGAAPAEGAEAGPDETLIVIAEDVAAIGAEEARRLEQIGEVSFLVQELRQRLGQEPHALLGVAAGAGRAEQQAAFHRIAKVLHPDRLPRGCAPELVLEAGEVFRAVTAAFESGGSPAAAAAPAAAPQQQRVRAGRSEDDQARRFFAQGREWISKRNYWQAADALRQAVRLKPGDSTFRQYLGLALMQTKRLHEAEEHLVEATRIEPGNASHYVNLGRIYRAGRLYKKAREVFERALRLDPRNEHAREELSDLPEEPAPARKAENGGLLKKLFGK